MAASPQRQNHRPVTQAQIAAEVGCSQNTVALALRHSKRISEKRRHEILRTAERLGYHPNIAARSLRSGHSGLVGVFTGTAGEVHLSYVGQIMRCLHSSDYNPVVGVDWGLSEPWYDAPWVTTLRELRVEAVVSFAWHAPAVLPPWHDQLPIIFSGYSVDQPMPCDCVNMDRQGAARIAGQYLIDKGHRRIGLVVPHEGGSVEQGYRAAMSEAGLEPAVFLVDEARAEHDLAGLVSRWRSAPERPTAVCVLHSPLAVELCNLAMRAGLRVPEDLAVLGYGYMQWADRMAVPLTTIEQPLEDLAGKTVEALLNRLEDPSADSVHLSLPFRLELRQSA